MRLPKLDGARFNPSRSSFLEGAVTLAKPPAPGHTAYSTIVQDENDLVGLVAYSLYKRDKIDFMAKHLVDTGQPATSQDIMAFCRTSTLPGPVSAYQAKATYLLSEMYDELLEDAVEEVDVKYKAEMMGELKKVHPFWGGVWQHLLAGLMSWAIIGFIILVLYGHKIGYKELATDILGLNTTPAPSSSKP